MRDQYIRAGHGFLLVFSLTSKGSFESMKELHQRIVQVTEVRLPLSLSLISLYRALACGREVGQRSCSACLSVLIASERADADGDAGEQGGPEERATGLRVRREGPRRAVQYAPLFCLCPDPCAVAFQAGSIHSAAHATSIVVAVAMAALCRSSGCIIVSGCACMSPYKSFHIARSALEQDGVECRVVLFASPTRRRDPLPGNQREDQPKYPPLKAFFFLLNCFRWMEMIAFCNHFFFIRAVWYIMLPDAADSRGHRGSVRGDREGRDGVSGKSRTLPLPVPASVRVVPVAASITDSADARQKTGDEEPEANGDPVRRKNGKNKKTPGCTIL